MTPSREEKRKKFIQDIEDRVKHECDSKLTYLWMITYAPVLLQHKVNEFKEREEKLIKDFEEKEKRREDEEERKKKEEVRQRQVKLSTKCGFLIKQGMVQSGDCIGASIDLTNVAA
jgi:hypothetical protein